MLASEAATASAAVAAAEKPPPRPVHVIPSQLAVCSKPGRKHSYRNGKLLVNEDSWGYFTLQIGLGQASIPRAGEPSGSSVESFFAFYIADGHGQAARPPRDPADLAAWPGSRAEQFCRLLQRELPGAIQSILEAGLAAYAANPPPESPAGAEDAVVACLKAQLATLHQQLNQRLSQIDGELLQENGSTFCLGLVWRAHLLAINIGDSSMLVFDRSTGRPLRVWRRDDNHHAEADPHYEVCSYEDTLAHFPTQIREGQFHEIVRKDYDRIIANCRIVTNAFGQRHYPVYSTCSPYGLAMTNTLGNLHHAGRTFSRTSVYAFRLPALAAHTSNGALAMCLVTDGVKDVMSSALIGGFFGGIRAGVEGCAASDLPALVPPTALGSLADSDVLFLAGGGQVAPMSAGTTAVGSLADCGLVRASRLDGASLMAHDELLVTLGADADSSQTRPTLVAVSKAIVNAAILRQSYDDVTCLLVEFQCRPDASGSLGPSSCQAVPVAPPAVPANVVVSVDPVHAAAAPTA